jgi:hypothetical protein
MNEINSNLQIVFFILFQLALRIIGEPISLYPKLFLFFLVDVCMVLIVVSEWFRFEVEWRAWVLKVFGNAMP